jgi:hypothetical protein
MALFAFFVVVLGLVLNAIRLFLVWARLGDIVSIASAIRRLLFVSQTSRV